MDILGRCECKLLFSCSILQILLEKCSQGRNERRRRKTCRYFLLRLLQMRAELEVKKWNKGHLQPPLLLSVKNSSSLQDFLLPVLGDAVCHHLLSTESPIQHLQLLVPTFQFAPLVRIPDLMSQTLTAIWTAMKSPGRIFAHFTTASKWLLGCLNAFLMKTFTERHKEIFNLNTCETRVMFKRKIIVTQSDV